LPFVRNSTSFSGRPDRSNRPYDWGFIVSSPAYH
jgi:hypothetical protein